MKNNKSFRCFISESVLVNMNFEIDSESFIKECEENKLSILTNIELYHNTFDIVRVLNYYFGEYKWKILISTGEYFPKRVSLQKQLWFCNNIHDNCDFFPVKSEQEIFIHQHVRQKNLLISKNKDLIKEWNKRGGYSFEYKESPYPKCFQDFISYIKDSFGTPM